jgi:hypothetical protein
MLKSRFSNHSSEQLEVLRRCSKLTISKVENIQKKKPFQKPAP